MDDEKNRQRKARSEVNDDQDFPKFLGAAVVKSVSRQRGGGDEADEENTGAAAAAGAPAGGHMRREDGSEAEQGRKGSGSMQFS